MKNYENINALFLHNKQLNEKELLERKTVLQSKPVRLGVVLTTKCNIDCIMCPDKGIKWELPDSLHDQITGMYPYLEEIYWRGGEVFL